MQVRRATELGKAFALDGVPAIVVNGKYRTSATQAGNNEKLLKVVNFLIEREAKAAPDVAPAPPAAPVQAVPAAPAS
jgi:thiol:disulfide interchange protein DsbA